MQNLISLFRLVLAVVMMAIHRGLAACNIPQAPLVLAVSEWTKIADLWVPEVLMEGMREPVVERASFIDSGVVATSREVVEAASGPGTAITIKNIVEPNHDDQQQQQDTAPEMRKLGSGSQTAAIFNRVSPLGGTALSGIVSGIKPGGDILRAVLDSVQGLRKRQRARLIYASLTGLFAIGSTPNHNSGAFKALRLDQFLEDGATPLAANLIDNDMVVDAIALSGENKSHFTGGAILMHSKIEAALNKQDRIDTIRDSEGKIIMKAYNGLTVIMDDRLVRNGGTSGKVYTTLICGLGSIAMGDKPQIVTDLAGEVAALQLDLRDVAKNNVAVYDRTRFICHPQGANWTPGEGVPSVTDAGPSNAELAAAANWALGAADVRNVRIVALRTNG